MAVFDDAKSPMFDNIINNNSNNSIGSNGIVSFAHANEKCPMSNKQKHHRRSHSNLCDRRSNVFLESYDREPDEPSLKRWLKLVLPHVGLVLLCFLYTLAGAALFYWMERPNEEALRKRSKEEIRMARKVLLESLWHLSRRMDNRLWTESAEIHLDSMTKVLFKWFDRNDVMSDEEGQFMWTFSSSVFFSASMITTIGYGNLVPVTSTGRLFCVLYGLFGIPLMLVTIADMGKFIGDAILLIFHHWEARKMRMIRKKGVVDESGLSESEQLMHSLELAGYDRAISVPALWILTIIIGYTALGGLLFHSYEDWTFAQAFYFSFITMSTVGFGDFVPHKQTYYVATLVYIVGGLAITTMCVDLVGSQYIQKIHYFGRKIRSAQVALRTVGDLMRYTAFLRRRTGKDSHLNEDQLDALILRSMLSSTLKAFTPRNIQEFNFIDQKVAVGMANVLEKQAIVHLRRIDDQDDQQICRI